ncbi:helix-turn-helix transcriptional regulator [Streptomyces celluloflavus]|uniref:helix-turn-helix transcriptional regulator n=1 Tax=Streptomyces celluloflavus TaxID=58344 RepID=UPI0034603209|nr:helix-turn-helix domain-containing protein [Streptomyces celluloflavus]
MPVRQVDGRRVLAARRAAHLQQHELGKALGLSKTPISEWERGLGAPPPERLPAIARILRQELDVLFPRLGPPDLKDLRCDAGYTQAEAAAKLGISRLPLSNGEGGKRRLNEKYVQPLADLYEVSRKELEAAQNRSFSDSTTSAAAERMPQTLGEKITYLLQRKRALSDQDLADAVNARAGFHAVDAAGIQALRTDSGPAEARAGLPPGSLFAGLADAFGVQPYFFDAREEIERQIIDRLNFLNFWRSDGITVAARGADRGVSAEMLATLSEVLVRHEDARRDKE